jgi:hypothetical protein
MSRRESLFERDYLPFRQVVGVFTTAPGSPRSGGWD